VASQNEITVVVDLTFVLHVPLLICVSDCWSRLGRCYCWM